jgi:hypothetical protein
MKIIVEQERLADADGGSKSSRKVASVGFANLTNIVAKRWRNISPADKEELEKQAKLEKERYMEEVAAWELEERGRREKEVIDLEADDDDEDDDTASRSDDQTSTNQGFAWEGGGVLYPNVIFPQWPTAALNQSIALNQASSSMTPNKILTINPASYSGILAGPTASSLNDIQLPFRADQNPQRVHPWVVPQGSLLFHDNNMPTHSFQFEGRRNSMPDSFQGGAVDPMTNIGFDTARQHGNRRASLFSSVREMGPDTSHESTFRPAEEIPIEEIKRFFNINPETNKVETLKHPRHNSCLY